MLNLLEDSACSRALKSKKEKLLNLFLLQIIRNSSIIARLISRSMSLTMEHWQREQATNKPCCGLSSKKQYDEDIKYQQSNLKLKFPTIGFQYIPSPKYFP